MAKPEKILFTVTQAGEQAIENSLGFPGATAVGVFVCRFRNVCSGSRGRRCGIELTMEKRPNSELPIPDESVSANEEPDTVTDVTVDCSNENCPEPERVQQLADTIQRAAGILPPLGQSIAHS